MNAIKELYSIINQLQGEKKELEQRLNEVATDWQTISLQLAASEADRLRLRHALTAMVFEARARNCGLKIADDALDVPIDDLSALREVCAKVIEEVNIARVIDVFSTVKTDWQKALRTGEWTPEVLK